jgi:DNA polymerase-3 subunit gamma/tau
MSDIDLHDEDGPPWAEDGTAGAQDSERDENTEDMFGAPAAAEAKAIPPAPAPAADSPPYTVIARKYRPRRFEDLIGQEAMVRTLTNAFASGRIAHAFMLTGVRGVGKTTTARLLARALNYESDTVNQPSVDLSVEGYHCRAIIEGRQMDVLELDAASRTKVDEMRELLDGARYAPVETRFKVYVIDEVHMLSTAAFNALLKTLEEPPPHVKFIFATTEIRKVPVTILSRCQRFDLRRVEPEVIAANLKAISQTEGAKVEAEALSLIARAAEGSVRDAQSLLDQAIVQAEPGQPVSAASVRDMLGLADRTQTIALFEQMMKGQTADALAAFRTLYGFGAAPDLVMLDLLEHSHAASVAKALGPDALHLPSDQAQRLTAVGATASAGTLSRVWSMLLKSHDEVRRAPDPFAAVEMALIRLSYAADLPGPEEALRRIQSGEVSTGPAIEAPASPPGGSARAAAGGGGTTAYAQPQASLRPLAAPEAQGLLQSFEDVVKLIETKRDALLKVDVDRFVRLVDFKPGVITFAPAPGAPANLHQRLSNRLKEWTGQPWRMVIEGGGGSETAHEREQKEARAFRDEAESDPIVQALLTAFPGAEVIGVRRLAQPTADTLAPETGPDSDDDNDD